VTKLGLGTKLGSMELPVGLEAYVILAAALFVIGLFGVVTRRNTVGILLGIELMLNAVNINVVAFARFNGDVAGFVFPLFLICITVAEVAVGLALVILIFRVRRTRKMAMTIASPTATSATVMAIVSIVKTRPPMSARNRAKATRLMLTAFSISSMPSRMPTALRRVSTPKRPMANTSAASMRYAVSGT